VREFFCDDLVRVHALVRLLAEELAHELDDLGHAGHAADQYDFVNVLGRDAGVGQRLLARLDRALDEIIHQLLELGPRQLHHQVLRPAGVRRDERQIDLGLLRGRELDLRALGRFLEALQSHAVLFQVYPLVLFELLDQPIHDPQVEVVAAQEGVAVGGLDLKHSIADLEDGDVEGAPAQVVDRNPLILLFVQAVGQRGGRRLVDDAEHVEARDLAGVLSGLPLAVVEVGGHRDDCFRHRLAQVVFRSLLHLLEDHGRDFGGAVTLPADLDVRVTVRGGHHLVGKAFQRFAYFLGVILPPDQALDRVDGVLRIRDGLALRDLAHQSFALLGESHHRRSGSIPFRVGDDDGVASRHDGHAGVRCPKIDSNYFTHVFLLPFPPES